jgi:capsular polysaccharide transport system permease protein
MAGMLAGAQGFGGEVEKHRHIIWALLMREMSTRYGRDNIGYLWLIAEPIFFCVAVSSLYTFIRPPLEYGLNVPEFTITGYMPMIMFRQAVGYSNAATRQNNGLLYHRQVTPLHLFLARFLCEFCGVSLAYMVIIFFANLFGFMPYPADLLLLVAGWLLLSFQAMGMAMFMNALSEIFDFVERFVQVLTYIFIPVSGFMFMISNLPAKLKAVAEYIPFIHCFELMRAGYFGPILATTYDIPYALAWGAGFVIFGLLLMQFVRPRVEVL